MATIEQEVRALQDAIDSHESIVFFGGAGVSTESGIPDYRGEDGIDKEGPDENGFWPEEKREHSFMIRHPEIFYKEFKESLKTLDVKPNATHYKLTELEKAGKLKAIVTQNIDGLHQKAGSVRVLELHGNMREAYCDVCKKRYPLDLILKDDPKDIPRCGVCGGMIRPDVVMFGEALNQKVISEAVDAISKADMLIIAGTSLVVYPAAGLVDYFRGDCLVLMDKQNTPRDDGADILIRHPIAEVFSRIEVL